MDTIEKKMIKGLEVSFDLDLDIQQAQDIRGEIESMEAEIAVIQGTIKKRKAMAIKMGIAEMAIDQNYTAQKRVPDRDTYIALHVQEAFDSNHTLTKARPRFTWK